jgi:transposase
METSVPPPGITPRQQLLIDALATGMTITRAAEHVGIARKTAYNWLETEAFQAALADRRKELAERVAERVAELGQASVSTLLDYLGADNSQTYEPGKVKLAERLLDRMGLLNGGKATAP